MDGVLVVDKPAGLTSHDVVAEVRRILRVRRVGHTGTLDPFATGVLVVLVGRATRLAQFLSGVEKEYEAVIRLGFATDTGDLTGERIVDDRGGAATDSWNATGIEAALKSLRGQIEQVPPMYSAKKQDGKRLYKLARSGEEVERQPVSVSILAFEAVKPTGELLKDNLDGTFDFEVRVVSSSGTYIRTLAEDFGKRLNIGAHLVELRRTRAGDFSLAAASTLEQIKTSMAEEGIGVAMHTPDEALSRLPLVDLTDEEVRRIRHGMNLEIFEERWSDGARVRLRDAKGDLIAVGIYDAAGKTLHPQVVLATDN